MMTASESSMGVKRNSFLCGSVVLYAMSLWMPAMYFEKEAPLHGFSVLAWGWWGLFQLNPAWLANPAYVIALMLFIKREYSGARWVGVSGLVCTLFSYMASQWYFNEAEGTPIKHLGSAFYVWFFAQAVLLAGSVTLRQEERIPIANDSHV
jgi:hypothetical protein